MTWHEHPLTVEQRTANWMWMAATDYTSHGRGHAGHGQPPATPDWQAIPGDQWFDVDTGRAWIWRDDWSGEVEALNSILNMNALIDHMVKTMPTRTGDTVPLGTHTCQSGRAKGATWVYDDEHWNCPFCGDHGPAFAATDG